MTDQALQNLRTRHQARGDREKIPRFLLRAVLALVLTTLALVTIARVTGMEPVSQFPESDVVQERTLRLYAEMSGAVRVLDGDGSVIADLGPDDGGFIAGIGRSLALKRRPLGIDPSAPVRLVKFADGRLGLRDDLTGWRVELIGFGRDNTAAFARLLEQ